ncbi:Prefoldin subunit 3, partial [Nakaseomyces glabratus]
SALKFNYKLNETLFTKAQVDLTKDLNVGLWLGADVMLEYPIDEAIALLEKKLEDSQDSLRIAKEDVEFLRENITTMEVNCARLYNWDVELRKATKATEKLAI